MGASTSSFETNCTNITAYDLQTRNLSRCISAIICTLGTLAILLVLLWKRAHKTTLQRLFLYPTIIIFIQLVFISMNIELQFRFDQRYTMCEIIAFFTVWSAISTYLLAMVITFYLVFLVYGFWLSSLKLTAPTYTRKRL